MYWQSPRFSVPRYRGTLAVRTDALRSAKAGLAAYGLAAHLVKARQTSGADRTTEDGE